jgi:hypothetical protein
MTYVSDKIKSQTYNLPEYEWGYWLCYLSVFLFLLAFYSTKSACSTTSGSSLAANK